MLKKSEYIIPLSNISNDDKDLVGEKAAMFGELIKQGFPIPDGFVITQNAFHQFALKHKLPDNLIKEIFRAYKHLAHSLKDATVEIIPSSKEKGVLMAKGEAVLFEKIKYIWSHNASSIVVRKIPQTSNTGTMFTIHKTQNIKPKIVIYENNSKNHYEVLKMNLKITFKAISNGTKQKFTDKQIVHIAQIGKKLQQFFYFPQEVRFAIEKNKIYITQTKPITHVNSKSLPKANNPIVSQLIQSDKSSKPHMIKVHNSKSSYHKIDSIDENVQILKSQRNPAVGINKKKMLLKGNSIYPGIATGHLRIIQNMQDLDKVLRGEVIVIPYQDLIKHTIFKAGAVVATDEKLFRFPHLTIGPYFSGIPTVITTPDSAGMLRNGTVVTVNGKNGEVYIGS